MRIRNIILGISFLSIMGTSFATPIRKCGTANLTQAIIKEDPAAAIRLKKNEAEFQQLIAKTKQNFRTESDGTIVIPVVVNVVYRTAEEKISKDKINSQITVLNQDYTATNTDFSLTPVEFQSVAASMKIRFELVKIARKSTTVETWDLTTSADFDKMKYTASGGLNATDPSTKLNFWVVGTLADDTLGFATFPSAEYEPTPNVSGVVIAYNYFGTVNSEYPYNLGRTATHEVGHWLNLLHIWGDESACNADDEVADTPLQDDYSSGVPSYPSPSSCVSGNEMTMNYMDYTDDRGMYMFTAGQKNRVQATFETSYRTGFK